MRGRASKNKNLIALKGNHDDWFLEFLRMGYPPTAWTYGGINTIKSYSSKTGQGYKTSFNPEVLPLSHKQCKGPGNDRYKNTYPGRMREGVFRF